MTEKIRLTHKWLDEVSAPQKRRYVYDEPTPGLAVCITPKGVRTWYVIARIHKQPTRLRLGEYPQMPVDRARVEAKRIMADAAEGKQPRARANTPTLGAVFDRWMESYAKHHKKTWVTDERRFERVFSHWRNRTIASISRPDVESLHVELGTSAGHYAANRMLEMLKVLYRYAGHSFGYDGPDPSSGIQRFEEIERERFLTADEMPRFFAALEQVSRPATRDFIMLCLLTGARRSNVMEMEWTEIDFATARWTIPREKSKNKRAMVLPLTEAALIILRRRFEHRSAKWVLPGPGKTGHYIEPKDAWRTLLKRAGISDLRIHDLRRTLGSWQAMSGASMLIIAKSLGHGSTDSTKVYARLQMDPVAASVDAATKAIMNAAQQNQQSSKNQ